MDAKCNCPRASDDPNVDLQEHDPMCARRAELDAFKERAFIIDHKRVACGVHLLPFRDRWPLGFPTFAVKAFQVAAGLPGIWDEALKLARPSSCTTEKPCANCKRNEGALCLMSSPTDPALYELGVKALEAVLDVRPVCCRISRAQLVELYKESRVGVKGRCRWCGRMKTWGTPIDAVNTGPVVHVCFECIASASSSPQSTH